MVKQNNNSPLWKVQDNNQFLIPHSKPKVTVIRSLKRLGPIINLSHVSKFSKKTVVIRFKYKIEIKQIPNKIFITTWSIKTIK
jgi:ribosomal protein S8